MTTVYGAVAVICWPKAGEATDPPVGQVIAIAGTGGGGVTGLDDAVVEGTVATCSVSVRCVAGADVAVEVTAARESDAVCESLCFPRPPARPMRARTPTTPIPILPLLDPEPAAAI